MARFLSWLIAVEAHGIAACVVLLSAATLRKPPEADGVVVKPPGVNRFARAFDWLAKRQLEDGQWTADVRSTALVYLAFASADGADYPDFSCAMDRAVRALLRIDEADPVRTLALIVAARDSRLPVMSPVAQRAVDALLAAQRTDGTWDDDETTAWAIVALAEALLANFDVPAAALRRALAHVDGRSGLLGRPDEFLLAAVALVRLLDRQAARPAGTAGDHRLRYLTARALALVDRDAAAAIRRDVGAAQRDDGSWDGDVAATALAALTLAIR